MTAPLTASGAPDGDRTASPWNRPPKGGSRTDIPIRDVFPTTAKKGIASSKSPVDGARRGRFIRIRGDRKNKRKDNNHNHAFVRMKNPESHTGVGVRSIRTNLFIRIRIAYEEVFRSSYAESAFYAYEKSASSFIWGNARFARLHRNGRA